VTATRATPQLLPALHRRRWIAWSVTWLSYATYYFGRKNLSVTKATIGESLGEHALYGVETTYLAAYALGQYGSGLLGDRVGARRVVGCGMLAAGLASFVFGLSSTGALFILIALANGLAQSTGWSGNGKAMQEWTTVESRGRVMGVWATCYQVGGIAATAFATALLARYGWRSAYLVPGVVIALVGLLVLAVLRPGPITSATRSHSERDRSAVLRSPILWSYGASYFFIKLIRYALLFWLPFYLQRELHYTKGAAGYLSTSFEIGGIAGVIAMGWLSDRLPHVSRSVVSAVSLVCLACALFIYIRVAGTSHTANFTAMAMVGFLLFGPDALLSGAAAQDLGGPNAAALAIGMINGCGSVGAVLQEVTTRTVSGMWGWNAVFYVLLASALLGAAALAPTFRGAPR
jgi:sugar phosphate permease